MLEPLVVTAEGAEVTVPATGWKREKAPPAAAWLAHQTRWSLPRTKTTTREPSTTAETPLGDTSRPALHDGSAGGVGSTRASRSPPPPLLVVTKTDEPADCTVRIRPTVPSRAASCSSPVTRPSGVIDSTRTPVFLSSATASAPSQRPQELPDRNVIPLVATVGRPELHRARTAEGNFAVSVIGTDWT